MSGISGDGGASEVNIKMVHKQPEDILRYIEEGSGKEYEFSPYLSERFKVDPLNFSQLIDAVLSERPTISLRITNAENSEVAVELGRDGPLIITTSIQLHEAIVAYGLVDGGWLPMPLANNQMALLDRNLVIKMASMTVRERPHWANWLGLDTKMILSPMLFALEGNMRRPPTECELAAELSRACTVLRSQFPSASVLQVQEAGQKALYSLLCEHGAFRDRATRFLVKAAPMVAERVGASKRLSLEKELVRAATNEGVECSRFVFLALLSCVYEGESIRNRVEMNRPGFPRHF